MDGYRQTLKEIEAYLAEHGLEVQSYRPGRERLYQVVERRGEGVYPVSRYMTFAELRAWYQGFREATKAVERMFRSHEQRETERAKYHIKPLPKGTPTITELQARAQRRSMSYRIEPARVRETVVPGVVKISPYEWEVYGERAATIAVFMDSRIPDTDMKVIVGRIGDLTGLDVGWAKHEGRVYVVAKRIAPMPGNWPMYGVWKGAEKMAEVGIMPGYVHAVTHALEERGYKTANIGSVTFKT